MRHQCTIYKNLSEEDRRPYLRTYSQGKPPNCDSKTSKTRNVISPNWKGAGWYRFQHPAGNKLAQSPPGSGNSGTSFSVWSNSPLPDNPGDSVHIKICFVFYAYDCYRSNRGKVTNCGSYYVYYLENTPHCNERYCGNN